MLVHYGQMNLGDLVWNTDYSRVSEVGLKLRWVPPTVFLLGSAPSYCVTVSALRILGLPFGSRVVNALEDVVYACYQSLITLWFDVLSGVKIIHYGDKMLPENAIYLSNHQCTADWAMVEVMTIRHDAWGFSRYVLKDSLKFVPLYGISLWMHGCMFVRRRGLGAEKLSNDMKQLVKAGRPLWLVIFPEGTRYNILKEDAIKKSQQYAKDNGLQPLAHLLTPRTSGFEVALQSLRDHVSSVYDVTVVYEGPKKINGRTPAPSMFSYFDGRCTNVHFHVSRIPIGDIPQDNEGQRQWLYERYIEKDKMIGKVLHDGRFDGPQNIPTYPVFQLMIPSTVFVTMAAAAGYKYPSVRLLIATVTGLYMIGGFVLFTTTTSY